AIYIAGLVFGEDAARGQVVHHLQDIVGLETAQAIEALVETAAAPQTSTWAAYIGFAVVLIGSLGVFLHVRSTLCMIWKLDPPRGSTLLGILLDYLLAILMVLVTGVLLLGSLAASTAMAILVHVVEEHFPGGAWRWQLLEFGVSIVFLTLLFAA